MKGFSNISVLPVGLEVDNFSGGSMINYREKLGIPSEYKILLYVGKVEKRRKPFFCIDVYEKVKEKYENCCLVYVGSGPLLEEVHDYSSKKHLKDIHFIDRIPQNELPSLYTESSLFILPTRYEIFGMVIMEAMYFGVPVITYKAAGPIDIIENDVDGIVMSNFNTERWADKIYTHLIEDDLKTMGEKGKKKIIDKYLWPTVATSYYKKYKEIIRD